MKHIKKFETLNSANGFVIPKPFVGSIQGGQTIVCNEEDKKIIVNNEEIEIIDDIHLPKFYIENVEYTYENGMNWWGWIRSDYNKDGYYINREPNSPVVDSQGNYVYTNDWNLVYSQDDIINEHRYRKNASNIK